MAKETAEQKLLKVIESAEGASEPTAPASTENAPAPDAAAEAAASSVKGSGVAFTLPPFLDSFLGIFKGLKSSDKSSVAFDLHNINQIMLISISIIVTYFLIDFIKGVNYSNRDFQFQIDLSQSSSPRYDLPSFEDVSEYLATIAERNIFQPFEEKEEEVTAEGAPEPSVIGDMMQELKLVGISWLDTPESASALIENTTSGVTHFLKSGEAVNGVQIKEIYRESVIFTYQGEELEMSL